MSGHLPLHHDIYLVVVPQGERTEVGDPTATGLCAVGESRVSDFLELRLQRNYCFDCSVFRSIFLPRPGTVTWGFVGANANSTGWQVA